MTVTVTNGVSTGPELSLQVPFRHPFVTVRVTVTVGVWPSASDRPEVLGWAPSTKYGLAAPPSLRPWGSERALRIPRRPADKAGKVRRSGVTTIVGLGIVTAIFMAVMSVFYLQQIPTAEDLDQLQGDLRREHGLYLSSSAPLKLDLVRPKDEGERTGLRIVCTMRPDIRKKPGAVEVYLARMAESVLLHPKWRGRIASVTVAHSGEGAPSVTRYASSDTAKKP